MSAVADISPGSRRLVNWHVERSMLDHWARWLRRNRYPDAPRRPRCNLGKIMDLGMPSGVTNYTETAADLDEDAELVDQFIRDERQRDQRIYRALIARHLREYIDRAGVQAQDHRLKEKDIAVILYGGQIASAARKLRRDCDEGYHRLHEYARFLDTFVLYG